MATQENFPKLQAKSNTTKLKKEVGKWCKFHKIPTHNTSECWAKQSLVAEIKAFESDAYSDTESEPEKGNDKGKKLLIQIPMPLLPPRRSKRKNQKIRRRRSVFSTPRCG